MPLFRYVRILLFALAVAVSYFFWDWKGASILENSVHKPSARVEASFINRLTPEVMVSKERVWSKQNFHLSELRGTPIIVHFWATWCGPCLEELPDLLSQSGKWRNQGYSIVAVAVDESWAKLETFFTRYPQLAGLRDQTILVLDPEGKIAEKFGSTRFPETFLINDQLVIDNKLVGAQPWSDAQITPYLERLRTKK